MPYIDHKWRQEIDPYIDALAQRIAAQAQEAGYDGAFTGLLNYAILRLALAVVQRLFGGLRYWLIAALTGVFHNVTDEFYRRVAGPYEDRQRARSGDVDLLVDLLKELETS